MSKTYYLGLDVHKEKVAIAHAAAGEREDPVYYGKCAASVQNTERTLRKIAKKLEVELRDLKICYEAGPTGFVLARRLIHLGVECVVVAPTKTERKPGEKIKTDRRDAQKLASGRSARQGQTTFLARPEPAPPPLREAQGAGQTGEQGEGRGGARTLRLPLGTAPTLARCSAGVAPTPTRLLTDTVRASLSFCPPPRGRLRGGPIRKRFP
jgi:hypothetical protein